MTLEQSVEILTDLYQCPHMRNMNTQNDAIKLGIEALKYCKELCQQSEYFKKLLLPGETKE